MTTLTFLNRQADGSDAHVVLFQQVAPPGSNVRPLAWKVIRYCGRDCSHPFRYGAPELGVIDAYGNHTPRLRAAAGERYRYGGEDGARRLTPAGGSAAGDLLLVRNELPRGAIRAVLGNDGRPVAVSGAMAPQQVAGFRLAPVLWIAFAADVEEGQALPADLLAPGRATPLHLDGLASARIVLRGGGKGTQAGPLVFTLDGQVPA